MGMEGFKQSKPQNPAEKAPGVNIVEIKDVLEVLRERGGVVELPPQQQNELRDTLNRFK